MIYQLLTIAAFAWAGCSDQDYKVPAVTMRPGDHACYCQGKYTRTGLINTTPLDCMLFPACTWTELGSAPADLCLAAREIANPGARCEERCERIDDVREDPQAASCTVTWTVLCRERK